MDISSIVRDQNPWWDDQNQREARHLPERRSVFGQIRSYLGDAKNDRALALLGPRQIGKTTLLRQLIDDLLDEGWAPANITFFDFSDERLVDVVSPREIVAVRPPGLSADIPRIFLFDEIQNAPSWQKWLKGAVDHARRQDSPHPRYLVTGSAAASLRQGAVESGQGRWDELRIEGLTFAEYLTLSASPGGRMASGVSRDPNAFERYLALGGFPEHVRAEFPKDVRHRIREDIAERAILRDLSHTGVDVDRLRRLFVYLVTGSGNAWNQQKRAEDLQANRKSVGEWLSLLEETRLIVRLERQREKKANAQLRSQPKLFAADHGLISAFSDHPTPLADTDIRSRIFEAIVFRHLRDIAAATNGELTYLRIADNLEIDFVLSHPNGVLGVEVTSSTTARSRKLVRMNEAARHIGVTRKLVVYGGLISERLEDVEIVPVHEFILMPERYVGDVS